MKFMPIDEMAPIGANGITHISRLGEKREFLVTWSPAGVSVVEKGGKALYLNSLHLHSPHPGSYGWKELEFRMSSLDMDASGWQHTADVD